MKIVVATAFIFLAILPWFWYQPGMIDIAGDGGRIYYLNPGEALKVLTARTTLRGVYDYAHVANIAILEVLKQGVGSTTNLIALDHSVRLAFGFLFMMLFMTEMLAAFGYSKTGKFYPAFLGSFLYIVLSTRYGWEQPFASQNQVFLNPFILYLLLKYFGSGSFIYLIILLATTVIHAPNFGFPSSPQLFAFYPLSVIYILYILRISGQLKNAPRHAFTAALLFIGLHGFHLIPLIASFFNSPGSISSSTLDSATIFNRGVHYFDMNAKELGKISSNILFPYSAGPFGWPVILAPFVGVYALRKYSSKLLVSTAIAYAASLFLVSANITQTGHAFYRSLFYIPGFMMFRSFNEKWWMLYAFMASLFFAVGFVHIYTKSKNKCFWIIASLVLVVILLVSSKNFLQGSRVHNFHYQSNRVESTYVMSSGFLSTVDFVRSLQDDGDLLTLPLTFPNYQVVYGDSGGAYVGISIFSVLTSKRDYPGFWSFGTQAPVLFRLLEGTDSGNLSRFLALEGIRYIYHNSDPRIIQNFPGYPFVYPGEQYNDKRQLPQIETQEQYAELLKTLPLEEIYRNGTYSVYKVAREHTLDRLYIPERVFDDPYKAIGESEVKSAYVDKTICQKFEAIYPCNLAHETKGDYRITFRKVNNSKYEFEISATTRQHPFLLVLLEEYHPSWVLQLSEGNGRVIDHFAANGSFNGYLLSDDGADNAGTIRGSIRYGYAQWFNIGMAVSIITGVILLIIVFLKLFRKL